MSIQKQISFSFIYKAEWVFRYIYVSNKNFSYEFLIWSLQTPKQINNRKF